MSINTAQLIATVDVDCEPELELGRGIMFQTGPVRVSAVSVATDQTTIHHPYMVSTAPSTGSSRDVNDSGMFSQYLEMAPSVVPSPCSKHLLRRLVQVEVIGKVKLELSFI